MMGAGLAPAASGGGPSARVVLVGTRRQLVVDVVVAATPAARSQGLRGAACPVPGAGMLFVFPYPSRLAFVFDGVACPLDVAWLGPDGRVSAVVTASPGTRHEPYTPAALVLEVTAGQLSAAGVAPGAPYAVAWPPGWTGAR